MIIKFGSFSPNSLFPTGSSAYYQIIITQFPYFPISHRFISLLSDYYHPIPLFPYFPLVHQLIIRLLSPNSPIYLFPTGSSAYYQIIIVFTKELSHHYADDAWTSNACHGLKCVPRAQMRATGSILILETWNFQALFPTP